MNTASARAPDRPWPLQRWALYIGLACAAHFGFILAFGDRKAVVPRATVNPPALQVTTHRGESLQLDDPTLFALPHSCGFAGASWMRAPRVEIPPFRWAEPPRLLAMAGETLGAAFEQYVRTNRAARIERDVLPSPGLAKLPRSDLEFGTAKNSSMRVTGGLSDRRLLNQPASLPSWPASDLLLNSEVQVWVDADGLVLSPALLLPGSGSKEADHLALKLARAARFDPVARTAARLTSGVLVFEWHTVPQTNAVPATP